MSWAYSKDTFLAWAGLAGENIVPRKERSEESIRQSKEAKRRSHEKRQRRYLAKRADLLREFLAGETKKGIAETYKKYIDSPQWKFFRDSIIRQRGTMCERCGKDRPPLNVHHISYVRLGNELPEDVKVYCLPCHRMIHPGWER